MKKIIIIGIVVILVVALCIGSYFMVPSVVGKSRANKLDIKEYDHIPNNAIYFLNTGSSDAIIIKSGDHLAMVDSGEDSDNPRGFEDLDLEGFEQRVTDFVLSFAGEDGKVHLDFVVGTHAHSDHIGGFDTVISNPNVEVGKAYLKEYRPQFIREMEIEEWDNQEVYDQMVNALNDKNVPIISDISSDSFQFGDFTLRFLNVGYEDGSRTVGENDNSLVLLAEINGVKTLLTGDLDNLSGDEVAVAKETGNIDILKVGHHSYSHSTENEFLKLTAPRLAVITNNSDKADKRTLRRITNKTKAPYIFADDNKGICISFDGASYEIMNNACIY